MCGPRASVGTANAQLKTPTVPRAGVLSWAGYFSSASFWACCRTSTTERENEKHNGQVRSGGTIRRRRKTVTRKPLTQANVTHKSLTTFD